MEPTHLTGRDVLVLWRWRAANEVKGRPMDGSVGAQMRALHKGDRLFVCATHLDELFLLGAIHVDRIRQTPRNPYGSHRAEGRNLSGPFKIIPLQRRLLTQLRFVNTANDRLALS